MRAASILLISLALMGSAVRGEEPAPASPEPQAAAAPPADAASAEAIRTILDAGFRTRAAGATAATPPAAAAGRDSRVEYARGLVLLKQLKHRDAAAAFQAAASSRPPYLPAWQALIRTQLTLKEGDAALEQAERLAAQIADPAVPWSDEVRREAAAWLGRVAGYLALDGVELVDPPALRTAHETRVRLALDEPLWDAWSRGRESIHRAHQALLKERAAARATIAADQEEQHQGRAAEIEAERTELDEKTETLKLTAREWQAWLDEQLSQTEKKLTALQKDFATLDAAAREVSNEIFRQQQELASLRLRPEVNLPGTSLASQRSLQIQQEALERQTQIARLQAQFDGLAARANTVSAQARALLAQRTAAAKRFERATGQLARQDATLRKWSQLLDKAANRNEPKAAAESNQYRLLSGRLTLVATYFELEPDAERKRLLEEVEAAP
jgi:hypothetical protein